MRIKEITIKDFRCFKQFSCKFAPGVNVLIGRNGSGKTALIHALHKAVSFIFSNDRSLGKEFLSQGNNTLNVRGFKEPDYRFDTDLREPVQDASISATAIYNNKELAWRLYRRNQTNAALYQSYYKDAFATFMKEWKVEGAALPLLAYYSDSYPHKYVKTVKYALDIVNNGVMPRNFGYYQWDDEASCTSIWETRMCNCLNKVQPYYTMMGRVASELKELEETNVAKPLKENAEYQQLIEERERISNITSAPFEEMEYVERQLKSFVKLLPGIKEQQREIDFFAPEQTEDGFQLVLHFKNGSSSLLQDMPAGYRRLYSIVFDIAYRSYILNGDAEPVGIVIIDEIDLHLHPSLEQAVVECFSKTFPKVQFIISTHSAAVISNLDTVLTTEDEEGNQVAVNQILAMREGCTEADVLPSIYGIDYSDALRDFMDTPSRNAELKVLEDLYLTYLGHRMSNEAETVYRKIIEFVGEDSLTLQRLQDKAAQYEVH